MKKLYALLVGINAYEHPVPPLRGCLNDVEAIEELIRHQLAGDAFLPVVRTLKDAEATRENIINGFREHLARAASDDVVWFYFSGHGSQEPAPREFWHMEPSRLNSTLVCYDSRQEGKYDLADKELSQLIADVGTSCPHIFVTLDSCHSGSGTRGPKETGVRRTVSRSDERPLDTYLFDLTTLDGYVPSTRPLPVTLPHGRHIAFSACRSSELAREASFDRAWRGVFSYHLANTLQQYGTRLTYDDVFKRVQARTLARSTRQYPLQHAKDPSDLHQPVLGGAIARQPDVFTVRFDAEEGWTVDAGIVHGMPEPRQQADAQLDIYPLDVGASLGDRSARIGTARVLNRHPYRAGLKLDFGTLQPVTDETYKALITVRTIPPLPLQLKGEEEYLEPVRQELERAAKRGAAHLREVQDEGDLVLVASESGYRIVRGSEDRPLAVSVEGTGRSSVLEALRLLKHIERWLRVLEVSNGATDLPPDAVQLEVLDENDVPIPTTDGELRLHYTHDGTAWKGPRFKLRLTNTSDKKLFCMLLALNEEYEIEVRLLPDGGVWLEPGESVHAHGGRSIPTYVPPTWRERGILEARDTLKLLISTAPADQRVFAQESLDVEPTRTLPAKRSMRTELDYLMNHIQSRGLVLDLPEEESDWATTELCITTVHPRDEVEVPPDGEAVQLAEGVTLMGHGALRASARLTSLPVAARGADNALLPPIILDHPEYIQPLQLSTSRDADRSLCVFELSGVEDTRAVTEESPLHLQVEQPLGADEQVLPLAFDGEFYVPVGTAAHRESDFDVVIDRLPEHGASGEKGAARSLKIVLQKVVSPVIGRPYEYPLLRAIARDGDAFEYDDDTDEIRTRVGSANRVALLIHGIIGETDGMARSVFHAPTEGDPLASNYDLFLTFDYESLKTEIRDTARELKQRLEAVGLGPGHGKALDIVAHSMGGLVSRWFVEREGGNKIVNRLVMLGTPNAGSPWPTVKAWASTATGLLVNGFGVVAWPVNVLSGLLKATELVDDTFKQLRPDSPILQELAASPDPKVPYIVIAGDTGIVVSEDESDSESRASWFRRLIRRVAPKQLLQGAAGLVFWGVPNDVAVSVESAKSVPDGRSPEPQIFDVACDHMSYFQSESGYTKLRESL